MFDIWGEKYNNSQTLENKIYVSDSLLRAWHPILINNIKMEGDALKILKSLCKEIEAAGTVIGIWWTMQKVFVNSFEFFNGRVNSISCYGKTRCFLCVNFGVKFWHLWNSRRWWKGACGNSQLYPCMEHDRGAALENKRRLFFLERHQRC